MDLAILFRGFSKESSEAKKILSENNVEFVEVFSEDRNHSPVFSSPESAYSYKGINKIREYANSIRFKNENEISAK